MSLDPGIGATDELSLRVSVATLVRVLFEHPRDGEPMLVLERKATAHRTQYGHVADIQSQPFGGAIRIHELHRLRDFIGDFHFDSEKSRIEQDFRIFVQPSDWPAIRTFCIEQFRRDHASVVEVDPRRELVEEFADALRIDLQSDQYICRPAATVVEDEPAPTGNFHASGYQTVRVYRIFEVRILDTSLAHTLITNSDSLSDQELSELALEAAQNGDRANAVLALSLNRITAAYLAMSPEERNHPIVFEDHRLDETVAAVLEGIRVPRYKRL